MSGPQPWQTRFEQMIEKWASSGGPRAAAAPSLDSQLAEFPLEPDDRWGVEMDDLHRSALKAYVSRTLAFVSDDLERGAQLCESPIERAMLYALALVGWEWADGVLIRDELGAAGLVATRGVLVEIEPQADVDGQRVDFRLTMSIPSETPDARSVAFATRKRSTLLIECDGHQWHERTKEQASRDRARDRRLLSGDHVVFRYTGSDIWRDVFSHAMEAVGELARRLDRAGPPAPAP